MGSRGWMVVVRRCVLKILSEGAGRRVADRRRQYYYWCAMAVLRVEVFASRSKKSASRLKSLNLANINRHSTHQNLSHQNNNDKRQTRTPAHQLKHHTTCIPHHIRTTTTTTTMGALCSILSCGCCAINTCSSIMRCCCGCKSNSDDSNHDEQSDNLSTASFAYTSVTTGRKNGVSLLGLSVLLSLFYQYVLGPAMESDNAYEEWVTDRWTSGGCNYTERNPEIESTYEETCRGNAGVYRVCMVTSLFFLFLAFAVKRNPCSFGKGWCGKTMLYLLGVAGTVFIPNEVFNDTGYLQAARVGGCLFIFVQQIILIDMAYEWNDNWVSKADEADHEEYGSGKTWLNRILMVCAFLYGMTFTGIGLLFTYFDGCSSNEAFMSVTVVGIVFITVAQLLGSEGSLLTSSCISAYAVWLCFMAVSKNPTESCNPMYGSENAAGIFVASCFTVLSMAWMGWSLTVEQRLSDVESGSINSAMSAPKTKAVPPPAVVDTEKDMEGDLEEDVGVGDVTENSLDEPLLVAKDVHDTGDGIVLDEDREENKIGIVTDDESVSPLSWEIYYGGMSYKICLALSLLSTWTAVSLTDWGAITAEGDAANPEVGEVSMWMIITSQWIVLLLYFWTLVAPKFFPNREF